MKTTHQQEIEKFVGPNKEIYLHGSRAKAQECSVNLPDGTDWDYAVDYLYLYQLEKALSLGWEEIVSKSYLDTNSSVVLQKMVEGDKIQVSSRKCLEVYKKAFEAITSEEYFSRYWQKNRDEFRKRLEELYKTHLDIVEIPW